jgi:phosphate transport system substrate-binding protein
VRITRTVAIFAALCSVAVALSACEDVNDPGLDEAGEARGPTASGATFTATVKSSVALLPLAKKAADVVDRPPGVEVDVKATSSADALASPCSGQVEVALSNRVLSKAERRVCEENEIGPIGALAAHQVVAVYKHAGLGIRCLTTGELRRLWRPGSDVRRYSELGRGFPDRRVRLIAYPPRSAAFEFFARRITGAERPLREDARRVDDRLDFERVVSESRGALAFAPYDLPLPDEDQLPLVAVDGGEGCVSPSAETVRSGAYEPLSAPLYMYSARRELRERAVKDFVDYVLDAPREVANYPGLVPPDPARYPEAEPLR